MSKEKSKEAGQEEQKNQATGSYETNQKNPRKKQTQKPDKRYAEYGKMKFSVKAAVTFLPLIYYI